jgi:hypothetical protein
MLFFFCLDKKVFFQFSKFSFFAPIIDVRNSFMFYLVLVHSEILRLREELRPLENWKHFRPRLEIQLAWEKQTRL